MPEAASTFSEGGDSRYQHDRLPQVTRLQSTRLTTPGTAVPTRASSTCPLDEWHVCSEPIGILAGALEVENH